MVVAVDVAVAGAEVAAVAAEAAVAAVAAAAGAFFGAAAVTEAAAHRGAAAVIVESITARPPAARCRGGEHNTDAVKTTALGGVGTLRPVRTAAADAAHRTSILESNARNSQRSLRDRCRPRCYGPSIRQR